MAGKKVVTDASTKAFFTRISISLLQGLLQYIH